MLCLTKRDLGPWWVQLLGAWTFLHIMCALLYMPAALKYSFGWLMVYFIARKASQISVSDSGRVIRTDN